MDARLKVREARGNRREIFHWSLPLSKCWHWDDGQMVCRHNPILQWVGPNFSIELWHFQWGRKHPAVGSKELSGIIFQATHYTITIVSLPDGCDCYRSSLELTNCFQTVLLGPCSDFFDRVMPVFKGLKMTAIQHWFSALSLEHRFQQILKIFWWYNLMLNVHFKLFHNL